MAVITRSIGTTSRDYSTITLWEADLDDGGIYSASDDALGECYNDSAFDELVVIDGGSTIGLTSATLSVASGERHDGTSGSGARIVRTGAGTIITASVTDPTINVEWLELDANSQSAILVERSAGGTGTDATFSQLIGHGVSSNNRNFLGIVANRAYILNCIVYDLEQTHTGTRPVQGIGQNTSSRLTHIQNCTVHNMVNNNGTGAAYCYAFSDVANHKVQNCIGTDTSGTTSGTIQDYQQSSPSTATADHNLSSDTSASGTGSLTSKTSSAQFVSTTGGSEDLHLKSGADAIDAGTDLGTTPTGIEIDIDGRDRDAEGDTWDMGAHEFVTAGDTLLPNLVSETVTVYNPALEPGTVIISPNLTSEAVSVLNPAITSLSVLSPNLTSATVDVFNLSLSSLYTIAANNVSLAAVVNNPAMPYDQFLNPNVTGQTVLVSQPLLSTPDVIKPDTATAVVTVAAVSLQSGAVTILPLVVDATASVNNPRVYDPATFVSGFYSNDTMIDFFRTETGLDSYQFNELAKAYYQQVSSTDPEAFNESLIAAQQAAGFVGLAPTDWRNF